MKSKKPLGVIAAAALLGISAASAQDSRVYACPFSSWCVNNVTVAPGGGRLDWTEVRMQRGPTLIWKLYGGTDDEFRADSVVFTGVSAADAATRFPVREFTPKTFAVDNLNASGSPQTYELRVYKKGSPPGTPAVRVNGSIVNTN